MHTERINVNEFVDSKTDSGIANSDIMKALEDIGYRGFLTIEREAGQNPSADILTAKNHLINLVYHKLISQRDAALILAACSDVNFKILPTEIKDTVRASLLKQMLLTQI